MTKNSFVAEVTFKEINELGTQKIGLRLLLLLAIWIWSQIIIILKLWPPAVTSSIPIFR